MMISTRSLVRLNLLFHMRKKNISNQMFQISTNNLQKSVLQ